MIDKSPILSIIIISHEQREELRRCLESILAMELPFLYEIIVSDDRSTDGSYELACEFAGKSEEVRVKNGNMVRILALQCNSDEGNCVNNSQRSGYNRCNAYPHARGKYIAHVDADDYFRPGAKVYEKQVTALETHPDCTLAMSNCWILKDNEKIEDGHAWPFPRPMVNEEMIEAPEYIHNDFFRINQCFMQRRVPCVDPTILYGNRYVDSVITFHHLQYGKIVYIDACDYVYIRSMSSVTRSLYHGSCDATILWCLGLYISKLMPVWTREFLIGLQSQDNIRRVIALALTNYKMLPENYASIKDMHAFIYDCFGHPLSSFDKFRLHFAEFWLHVMKKMRIYGNISVNIARKLIF